MSDCLAPEPRDRPEVVRVQQILKLLSCEKRTFGISIRCWPPCVGHDAALMCTSLCPAAVCLLSQWRHAFALLLNRNELHQRLCLAALSQAHVGGSMKPALADESSGLLACLIRMCLTCHEMSQLKTEDHNDLLLTIILF